MRHVSNFIYINGRKWSEMSMKLILEIKEQYKQKISTIIHQNENLVFMRIWEVNMALGMNR